MFALVISGYKWVPNKNRARRSHVMPANDPKWTRCHCRHGFKVLSNSVASVGPLWTTRREFVSQFTPSATLPSALDYVDQSAVYAENLIQDA